MENFRGTDNLILAGHVEGDAAMLEVYVYNDVEDALYVHHDILLPSLPLALGRQITSKSSGRYPCMQGCGAVTVLWLRTKLNKKSF